MSLSKNSIVATSLSYCYSMEKQSCFFFYLLFFSLVTISNGVNEIKKSQKHHHLGHHHHHHGHVKLFVFGDSYLDTGNFKPHAGPWIEPYGMTFPGKPSGRFSDGRLLTDYIASYLGIKSPIPYKWRKIANARHLQYGMNFAYGGSGVFDTWYKQVNMSAQINHFKQVLVEKLYSKHELATSVALVSAAGNDYETYLQKNGTLQNMSGFTRRLINQLAMNLKRIHRLGVRKIAVTAIEPTGCLPQISASLSYLHCSRRHNLAAEYHNKMLQLAVQKLNKKSKSSKFVILDLYSAFGVAMNRHKNITGNLEYKNPLKPCVVEIKNVSSKQSRADIYTSGDKKVAVCKHPELSFFWDVVHPAQNGWHTIYLSLRDSLSQLY